MLFTVIVNDLEFWFNVKFLVQNMFCNDYEEYELYNITESVHRASVFRKSHILCVHWLSLLKYTTVTEENLLYSLF